MRVNEKRRYPRATLPTDDALSFLGARVAWPNHEMSDVLDISYKGLAVRRPGVFQVKDKEVIKLLVALGDESPYECFGRVVWSNSEWVGFEISSLPPKGHLALRRYLDDAILGLSLREVDKAHFSNGSTFQHWFQAGDACHVWIWTSKAVVIERIQFDIGGEKVELKKGQKISRGDILAMRALRILSQIKDENLGLHSFITSVGR